MRSLTRPLTVTLGTALFVGSVAGHVPLRNPANEKALEWSQPRVPVVIQLDGSDDVPDASDDLAIRMALEDWSSLDGSALTLVEDSDPSQRARSDWRDPGLHLVLFDEDGATGLFAGGGIVAITPVSFFSDGRIADADVLFNGRDHRFTTSGEPGAFDVQAIAAHELGHVAGFDHSGWAGSVLYPYVEPGDLVARSLSEDELGAARAGYPEAAFGSVTGLVVRSTDGTPVAGAHVSALDQDGRPRRSVLAGKDGRFALRGLDPGRYSVYVTPLDGPVAGFNLSGGQRIDTDFRALVDVGPVDVGAGGSSALGTLVVEGDGPLRLGKASDALPVRLTAGATAGATLRGTGLVEGCVLEASDPDLAVQNVDWNGGSVSFRVAVPFDEPPGHVDLVARAPDGEVSVLTAALELTPVDPLVRSVVPSAAGAAGGTQILLAGGGFREGCRVVVGDRIYREGVPGGARLLGDGSLSLTLGTTVEGLHDVVVIDRTGVEGRMEDGLLVDGRPVVATLFPTAGQAAGGTRVRVTGAGFDASTRVLLDGVEASGLRVLDATRLEFRTRPGAVGRHPLAVVDGRGEGAQRTFELTDTPDPELLLVDPGEGLRAGGETIELAGTNLDPGCRVRFGLDPDTGEGGADARVLEGPGGTRLVVVTPGLATTGRVAVAIEDPSTGQVSLLDGGFLVKEDEGSGGGGACATIGTPPRGPSGALEAGSWMLALFAVAALRAARARHVLA